MAYSADELRSMMMNNSIEKETDKNDNFDAELEVEQYLKKKNEIEIEEVAEKPHIDREYIPEIKKDTFYAGSTTTTSIRKTDKSDKDICFLKNVPRCLVDMVKTCFPDNIPNNLAVSAFLYANRCDKNIDYSDVPDAIKQLAKIYEQKNREARTASDIKRINENLSRLNKVNDDLVLALSYLIYDSNGFKKGEPKHPSEIDFYDPGIQQVTKKLEETSDKLRREYEYEQGKRKDMYGQKG